jgi:N-acetylneuraminic acid mutarotase
LENLCKLFIVVGNHSHIDDVSFPGKSEKGIIRMKDHIVWINGTDKEGLKNAERLLLRFAEMAKVESLYGMKK